MRLADPSRLARSMKLGGDEEVEVVEVAVVVGWEVVDGLWVPEEEEVERTCEECRAVRQCGGVARVRL